MIMSILLDDKDGDTEEMEEILNEDEDDEENEQQEDENEEKQTELDSKEMVCRVKLVYNS